MDIPQGKKEKVSHGSLARSEAWDNMTLRAISARSDSEADARVAVIAASQRMVARRAWRAESHASRHDQCNDCPENASTHTKRHVTSEITVLVSPSIPQTLTRAHKGFLIEDSDQS